MIVSATTNETFALPIIQRKNCETPNAYVSDFCEETYLNFEKKKTYVITCPTGSGKSYMCINCILPRAYKEKKKILLLVNRCKLKDQYYKEVMECVYRGDFLSSPLICSMNDDNHNCLRIMTYQELEERLSEDIVKTLAQLDIYDILIADEAHYFLDDATFNPKTKLSAEYVLMYFAPKTRFFLSATMQNIKPLILEPEKFFSPLFTERKNYYIGSFSNYLFEKDYNNAVEFFEYSMKADYSYLNVNYFRDNDTIIDAILETVADENWLYFVSDKNLGKEIVCKINEQYKIINKNKKDKIAVFLSAEYRNENNEEMIQVMDEITKFENSKVNVIVTTPVLDNGINLKSEKLKNIVICTDNNISFIQMLGRKRRINNLEKVNLYIPSENTTMFIKRKNNIENKMNDISRVSRPQLNNHVTSVLYYNNDTRVANSYRAGVFPLTYYFDNCAYTQYRVSELSMLQMQFLWNNYNKIIERFETEGENAFIYEQLSWVNLEYDQSRWMYDNSYAKNKDKLENILINYVNKNLSKAEFENIKEEIRSIIRTINTDVRSNRMSTKQANEGLEVFNSRYRFDDKEHKVVQILNNKENLFEENEACYLFESL